MLLFKLSMVVTFLRRRLKMLVWVNIEKIIKEQMRRMYRQTNMKSGNLRVGVRGVVLPVFDVHESLDSMDEIEAVCY